MSATDGKGLRSRVNLRGRIAERVDAWRADPAPVYGWHQMDSQRQCPHYYVSMYELRVPGVLCASRLKIRRWRHRIPIGTTQCLTRRSIRTPTGARRLNCCVRPCASCSVVSQYASLCSASLGSLEGSYCFPTPQSSRVVLRIAGSRNSLIHNATLNVSKFGKMG